MNKYLRKYEQVISFRRKTLIANNQILTKKMKKGEIFTFIAPKGVEVTAVVVDVVYEDLNCEEHKAVTTLCYAQNRLFTWNEEFVLGVCKTSEYGKIVVDYCNLPEYDALLKAEQ